MKTNFYGVHKLSRVRCWIRTAIIVSTFLMAGSVGALSVEQALRRTYGSAEFIDSWGQYTAAAYTTRNGPDIVLVVHAPDEIPRTVFRLSATLDDLSVSIGTPRSFRRFQVSHLQMAGKQGDEPWLFARIECSCSSEVTYIAARPPFFHQINVYAFTIDKSQAPAHMSTVPDTESPERSIVGLAIADGFVSGASSSGQGAAVHIVSQMVPFIPDPSRDCVACTFRGADLDSLEVHVTQYYGEVLPESRRAWSSNRGDFLLVAINSYDFNVKMDTLVLRRHRGRISLVYQYSAHTIPETEYAPPGTPYLWPARIFGLDDANKDGYPEVYATQVCRCGIVALLLTAIDFVNGQVLFLEYPTLWDGTPPDYIPYIRWLRSPTPQQVIMQAGLKWLLDTQELSWTEDPGRAIPLGAVIDAREGTLEPRDN